MSTPKGNAIAYQAYKPLPALDVGNLVLKRVDDMIAQGKAEEAARLKQMLEQQAKTDDMFSKIKIEPKEVDRVYTEGYNKYMTDSLNKVGEYHLMAKNAKTDYERTKYYNLAKKIEQNALTASTALGGTKFLDQIKARREQINNTDAFDKDEATKLLNAFENSTYTFGNNEDGSLVISYHNGDNLNDPPRTINLSELMQMAASPVEVDTLNDTKQLGEGMYSRIAKEANRMTEEWKKNNSGDLLTTGKDFIRGKWETDFDTRYGGYNANRATRDDNYSQMSRVWLPSEMKDERGLPKDEEAHNMLKKMYGDFAWSKTETASSKINEVSAYQRWKDNRDFEYKKQQDALDRKERRRTGGGSRGGSEIVSFIEGGVISRKSEQGNNLQYDNGMVINLKNKEYIAGFKFPNKDGKGHHVRYAILGTDESGRQAFEKWATNSDVKSRMVGYGIDPNYVQDRILSGKTTNSTQTGRFSGVVKYNKAYLDTGDQQSNPTGIVQKATGVK